MVCWWSLIETVVFETNHFARTDCGHCDSLFPYIKAMLKTSSDGAGSEYASIGFHSSSQGWFRILDSEDQAGVASVS